MDKPAIDKILDALKDGEYHTLKEITQKTGIKQPKTRLVIAFLQKYQFIELNKNGKIKLNVLIKQFLDKLDETDDPAPFYEEITA
jgi:DNA-binding IclR family transcriptional regulator